MVCDILLKRNNEGDFNAAKEMFTAIKKLGIKNEEVAILNARLYLHESKYKEVLKSMRRFIRAGNGVTDNSHLFLASVYFGKKEYNHAIKSIKDALGVAKEPYSYHIILPWLYYQSNRIGEAKREIDNFYVMYGYNDKIYLMELLTVLSRKLTVKIRNKIQQHADPGWHFTPHSPQLPILNPYL